MCDRVSWTSISSLLRSQLDESYSNTYMHADTDLIYIYIRACIHTTCMHTICMHACIEPTYINPSPPVSLPHAPHALRRVCLSSDFLSPFSHPLSRLSHACALCSGLRTALAIHGFSVQQATLSTRLFAKQPKRKWRRVCLRCVVS